MRLRTFVIYFWSFLMFVFAGFGTFYIITGDNILTGQSRDVVVANVLPASDQSEEGVTPNTEENEQNDNTQENRELLLFNEVMSKTSSNFSYKLDANDTTDKSVVFFRFGQEGDASYVAVYGSGLDNEKQHFAFLDSGDSKELLGELKKVDDTDVLKLGVSKEGSLEEYTSVLIATEEEFSPSLVTHEAQIDLSTLYNNVPNESNSAGEDVNDDQEENTQNTQDSAEDTLDE